MTDTTDKPLLTPPPPPRSFLRFISYWIWDGILEAARLGRRIKDPPYTQFHLSFLTMLLGAALVFPGQMWTPLSSFLQLWMPETLWGVFFLIIGRFGLHAMLFGPCRLKCYASGLLMAPWVFLTWVTFFSTGIGIGVIVFLYIAWRAGELMKLTCRKQC